MGKRNLRAISKNISILVLVVSLSGAFFPTVLRTHSPALAAKEVSDSDHPVKHFLDDFYSAWNAHDIEKLMSFYSKSFISADGIIKDDYKKLTERLWTNYPNIQLLNRKRAFRNQEMYSTVTTVDYYLGETKDVNPDFNERGKINALAQGSMYLKRYGKDWKIESDRINFELTTVTFGRAKKMLDENYIYFSAPEQVDAGQDYSAALYFAGGDDYSVSASVDKELVQYIDEPEAIDEDYQDLTAKKLERLFKANDNKYNELVSATALFYKGLVDPQLDGILFISKRVNVLVKPEALVAKKTVKEPFSRAEFNE
ncbi:MAG: hypothetical protein ACOYK1_01205 [Vampirovibrionia bacterium]